MANITKTFTMNLPDDYLAETSEDGLSGEWTYTGPDKLFVVINATSGALLEGLGYSRYNDDESLEVNQIGADTWAGVGRKAILITAEDDPILLAAFYEHEPDVSGEAQTTLTLPGESEPFYTRPTVQCPDKVYEIGDIRYDLVENRWVTPFPWRKPHINREQFLSGHAAILSSEKAVPTEDMTSEQLAKWNAYITEFENVPTTFADYLDTPWVVPFPDSPLTKDDWSDEGSAVGVSTGPTYVAPEVQYPVEIVGAGTTMEVWEVNGVSVNKADIEPEQIEEEEE